MPQERFLPVADEELLVFNDTNGVIYRVSYTSSAMRRLAARSHLRGSALLRP